MNFSEKFPRRRDARRVGSTSLNVRKKLRVVLWRHPRFTYRSNNRVVLCGAVFEWLIRCLQPFGRHTMLLEVISLPLPCFHPLFRLFVLAPWQPLNVSPFLFLPSHVHHTPANILHSRITVSLLHHSVFRWLHSYVRMNFYCLLLDITLHKGYRKLEKFCDTKPIVMKLDTDVIWDKIWRNLAKIEWLNE